MTRPFGLPRGEKQILVAMANFASDDGTDVYPGTARLVRMTGYSERWVREQRKHLRQRRVVIETEPATPTSPAHYRIDLDAVVRLAEPPELTSGEEPTTGEALNDRGGVNSVPTPGEVGSPKPSLEPSEEPPPEWIDDAELETQVEEAFKAAVSRGTQMVNPEKYRDAIRLRLAEGRREEMAVRREQQRQQATVDGCHLCNEAGWVLIETADGPLSYRRTHDPSDYEGLEISTASTEGASPDDED